MFGSPNSAASSPSSRFVRLARLCNRHRWRTFFAWLLALVALSLVAGAVGTKDLSTFRLPGTESQRAYDLLADHFPAQKGDTDQIVFNVKSGTLTDAANRTGIDAALKKVADQGYVASVASPFAEGGRLTDDKRLGV